MNSLTIKRENGNVPRTLAGKDHISGLIAYINPTDIPAYWSSDHVKALSTIDAAEAVGIKADAEAWSIRVLHYQLTQIYRLNDGIELYVGIFAKTDLPTFKEIKTVQNYANGSCRQIAIWDGMTAPTAANIALLHSVADALDLENAPLSILYAPMVSSYNALPINLSVSYNRVSVIIAQDGEGTAASLYTDAVLNKAKYTVSAIGIALGHLSSASVQESISWVKKFPSGISLPALGDGTLVRSIDKADLEKLDTNRYLFLTPIVGVTGSYWNDSSNMDNSTSDYAFIENVRTMDKAARGIRTYVTPELGGNVYIDETTGKMQAYTCEHLETTANKALEDMAKSGELSGYVAQVNPEQDVLSTSEVEIVIKNVPVGVIRRIKCRIGYVKSI